MIYIKKLKNRNYDRRSEYSTNYQINKQKLILIGNVAVGKISIINSFLG
jgi:hypothetical protein